MLCRRASAHVIRRRERQVLQTAADAIAAEQAPDTLH